MSQELSRRNLIEAVAAGAVGTVTLYASALAQSAPAQKQSKEEAQYQDKPKGGQVCGICTYFVAPTSCQKVDGAINPTGWCKNFALKK
jgi:hypothetical protein